jgi:hypothetical protein
MNQPRRRFRINLSIEGDSWEATGDAFARALRLLMSGSPDQIDPEKGFHAEIPLQQAGFSIAVEQDPKMTPQAYAELKLAYDKFTREAGAGTDPVR